MSQYKLTTPYAEYQVGVWRRQSPPYSDKTLCSIVVNEVIERYKEKPEWAKTLPYDSVVRESELEQLAD